MPVLKYRDPNDGRMKPISFATEGEVWVGPDTPPNDTYSLWFDTDDQGEALPDLDARFVNADGDTMTGELSLNVPDDAGHFRLTGAIQKIGASDQLAVYGPAGNGALAKVICADPTAGNQAATKGYVDGTPLAITGNDENWQDYDAPYGPCTVRIAGRVAASQGLKRWVGPDYTIPAGTLAIVAWVPEAARPPVTIVTTGVLRDANTTYPLVQIRVGTDGSFAVQAPAGAGIPLQSQGSWVSLAASWHLGG